MLIKIEMAYTVTCCKENEICCGSDKYASLGLFVVELVFVTPEISAVSTMISMLLWGLFVVDMMLVTGEILTVHTEFGFCCGQGSECCNWGQSCCARTGF